MSSVMGKRPDCFARARKVRYLGNNTLVTYLAGMPGLYIGNLGNNTLVTYLAVMP